MQVKDCMCKKVCSITSSDTVYRAAQIMNEKHIGSLPVCENNTVVGLITDRDIVLRGVAQNKNLNTTPISEIMTTKIIKTTPHTKIEDSLDVMCKNQIRRMPVISDSGLVGMLTIGDIANSDYINSKDVGEVMESICNCTHNHKNAE